MLNKILPSDIFNILHNKVNLNYVNEIRLRADKPIVLSIGGQRIFLGEQGVTANLKEAKYASKIMIEDIIFRASECSIYSVNEQIKKGFLVTQGGIRLGIGGDIVEEKGVIKTMTNYSSINIRLPHEVRNCSLPVFTQLLNQQTIYNTLILSPPGAGKTTFLRDFIWQLSERNYAYNVLVLDERGELDLGEKGGLGNFADKISFAGKTVGFENGIRSLAPNIIVTDELATQNDVEAVMYAANCGVSLLASVHCDSIESFCSKQNFEKIISERVFQRYVLLSMRNGPGTIEGVYNENFARIRS
ncbi:MAG: hypothetical protein J6A28_00580 [Clostridia bacterium]|nr:hypothetical protein [Clostridia bacterium]